MAGTYGIGDVPPLSVWEGQTLEVTVTSTFGGKALFALDAAPRPKGKIGIDAGSGRVRYAPDAEDRSPFHVEISASSGDQRESQRVEVRPLPKLASDFNVILSSTAPPEPDADAYLQIHERSLGREVFNPRGNGAPKVEVFEKEIRGVRVVLAQGAKAFDAIDGRDDLKRVVLIADELVIRDTLTLRGTEVAIHARRLVFDDAGGAKPSIVTVPRAIAVRADGAKARRGQAGGAIDLFVKEIVWPSGSEHVCLNTHGGDGQGAREGERGKPGKSVESWDFKATTRTWWGGHKELNWKDDAAETLATAGYVCTGAKVYSRGIDGNHKFEFYEQEHWKPTAGEPTARTPGAPGQGGDGGEIRLPKALVKDVGAGHLDQGPGRAGEKAKDVPAAERGTPHKACQLEVQYTYYFAPPAGKRSGEGELNRRSGCKLIAWQELVGGKPDKAPDAPGEKAVAGALTTLPKVDAPSPWLTPALVRTMARFFSDAFLAHAADGVRDVARDYLNALRAADVAKLAVEWTQLEADLAALLRRMDGPYDYFGNPAGWVPMLSFETNLKLYEREIDGAIRTMFLCRWIEHNQADAKAASEAIKAAVARLDQESDEALKDYANATRRLDDLDYRQKEIAAQLDGLRGDLKAQADDIERVAKESLQVEHILRGSLKILGGVMQLVPVGQPGLGAVGKGLSIVSDIDPSKPGDIVPDLAGVAAEYGASKLKPKAEKLFDKLSSTKDDKSDKDKKFDKELEKKKLKDKVGETVKEEKAAKAQILDAFGSFSVPDDELKAEVEKVKADSPEYKALAEKIQGLCDTQKDFAEKMLAVSEALDAAANAVIANRLAQIDLRDQLDANIDVLNPDALQWVREMGARSRARLTKYQYYMAQSYQYFMLRPAPGVDFRAEGMVEAFAKLLEGSKDGRLGDQDARMLRTVYDDQLKKLTGTIVDWFETHPPRKGSKVLVSLSPRQLEQLNSSRQRADINLFEMGYLPLDQEDLRITDIAAHEVEITPPPKDTAVNVSLTYKHAGVSRLRRGGQLFQFRSGDYAVDRQGADDPKDRPSAYRDDHMFWGTTVSDSGQGPRITAMSPDPAEQSLLRHLLADAMDDGSKQEAAGQLLNYRPAAWADIAVRRSKTPPSYAGEVRKLVLDVSYVFHPTGDAVATLVVRMRNGETPLIQVDTPDLNGRSDGRGSFLRSYDRNHVGHVVLTAPADFGALSFIGWRTSDAAAPDPDAPLPLMPLLPRDAADDLSDIDLDKLVRTRAIVVETSGDRVVEPIYAQTVDGRIKAKPSRAKTKRRGSQARTVEEA